VDRIAEVFTLEQGRIFREPGVMWVRHEKEGIDG
jgi:hypothetical protein